MDTSSKLFLALIALVAVVAGVYLATGTPEPAVTQAPVQQQQPVQQTSPIGVEAVASAPTAPTDSLEDFITSIIADVQNQAAAVTALDASVSSNASPTVELYDPSNQ